MSDATPFTTINDTAVAAAELRREPYEWTFIENALDPALREKVLDDAPRIPDRGSYALPDLKYGPAFGAVLQDLLSDRFRSMVGQKFDMDLSKCPPCIVMMGNTSGNYNEGYAHPDSKHKIVTVLVGFSRDWPYERGRLRVQRSNDRDDYAFEFAPTYGNIFMFRVSDKSWHGFLPQKGQRMSLQLCYVDSDWYVKREYWRHSISAYAKSVPMLRTLIDWAPRRL